MTGRAMNLGGVPIFVPNDVLPGEGFHISYNDRDTRTYGDVTTALVVGENEKFLVLNGNHIEEYRPLIEKGLEACLEYFKANIDKKNKYSEKL